jgi:hypothetical protein
MFPMKVADEAGYVCKGSEKTAKAPIWRSRLGVREDKYPDMWLRWCPTHLEGTKTAA